MSLADPPLYLAFPLQIVSGLPRSVDIETRIAEMIEQILFTSPGERVNRPKFGCGIEQLVFTPLTEQLEAATEFLVQRQLQILAKDYATILAVTVSVQDTLLQVVVRYALAATGKVTSLTVRRVLLSGVTT